MDSQNKNQNLNQNPTGIAPVFANGESLNSRLVPQSGSSEKRPEYTVSNNGTVPNLSSSKDYGYGDGGFALTNLKRPRPRDEQNADSNGAYSNGRPGGPRFDVSMLLDPRGNHNNGKLPQTPSPISSQPSPRAPSNGGPQVHAPPMMFNFDSNGHATASVAGAYNLQAHSNFPHNGGMNGASQYANGNGTMSGMGGASQYTNGNGTMSGMNFPPQPTPQPIDASFGGMQSMLDQLHNLKPRNMIPEQKRRKVEEGGNARFNGPSNGLTFAQHLQQREAQGTGPKQVFDLSKEDDDEVVVVPSEQDKEVCYGRVEGVTINASLVPTPKPGTQSLAYSSWPQIKIVLRRRIGDKTTIINALDSTRTTIGNIDVQTSIGLAPILDSQYGVRTSARILSRPRRQNDLLPGASISENIALDLCLYGPKKNAKMVGDFLALKQVRLLSPLWVEPGIELYNPQVMLGFAGSPYPFSSQSYPPYAVRSVTVRTTEEIRNDVITVFDSLTSCENLPEMEPSTLVTTPLLKHQKQGLHFMTNREKEHDYGAKEDRNNWSLWKLHVASNGAKSYLNVITGDEKFDKPPEVLGGILADMMGLGKTLTILSLVTKTLDEAEHWATLKPPKNEEREQPVFKQKRGAQQEIEAATLVLNCKTTLLVCPLSVISNWEEQIKTHIKPEFKCYVYHGGNRNKDTNYLSQFDLIITTYGAVATEFSNRNQKKEGKYPLEEMNWFRIVLDEAHQIREQKTAQFRAICMLSAQRRWAVTGTPIQNRLEDLGSLITFIRLKPFDGSGFTQTILTPFRECDPDVIPKLRVLVDSITLRRRKDKINLPKRHDHKVMLDMSEEERKVYEVFEKNAKDRVAVIAGQGEAGLGGRTYVHILQSILRLRLICAHGKDLLCDEDMKLMNGLSKDSAIDLDDDDDEEVDGLSPKQAYDMYRLMKDTNADNCASCLRKLSTCDKPDGDPKDQVIGFMTPCFHIICHGCIKAYKEQMQSAPPIVYGQPQVSCPTCSQHTIPSYFALKQGDVEDEEVSRLKSKDKAKNQRDYSHYSGPHTKTQALLEDLESNQVESLSKPDQPPIKSVVFSGWTSHLDLIQLALDMRGFKYTRLDGTMTRGVRSQAMQKFREDPSITVILVSITAGGLGLNLTTANKVYVMEPQYNPAAEAQAVDRVHRLGQLREVVTVRYIMKNSFEEKMLQLQDKKTKLAELSMDGQHTKTDRKTAAKQRLEELKDLFRK